MNSRAGLVCGLLLLVPFVTEGGAVWAGAVLVELAKVRLKTHFKSVNGPRST